MGAKYLYAYLGLLGEMASTEQATFLLLYPIVVAQQGFTKLLG